MVKTRAVSPGGTLRSWGDDHLHHEAAARRQLGGRVGEDRELGVLAGDVHDRVRHQVDQRERRPGHLGRGHVADGHRDRAGAGLGP
jgi:hypothetical protein